MAALGLLAHLLALLKRKGLPQRRYGHLVDDAEASLSQVPLPLAPIAFTVKDLGGQEEPDLLLICGVRV